MFNLSVNRKIKFYIASILATFMLTACNKQQIQQGQAIPVDVFVAKSEDVPVTSRLTGRATATKIADVRPQVTGVIQERLFVEGSVVKQGQQLYQIDPSLYQSAYDSAKANVSSAKASLHTAELKALRYRKLLNSNAVSKQEYDDANALYLQAKAQVEAAEANLQTAKINLAYTKVYAPISGRIGKSNVTVGALVNAQQATALATIHQLDPMYIDLGQSVNDHLALRQAMESGDFIGVSDSAQVDVYFSNGSKYEHQGKLEFSEVSVEESTGMVSLRAIVPNPKQIILPGMFIRADLYQGKIPNAVLVDQKAVIREAAGGAYVYKIDSEGKAKRQDIVIPSEYQGYYIVSSGIEVGDKVITSNLQKIRDGAPVVDAATLSQQAPQK